MTRVIPKTSIKRRQKHLQNKKRNYKSTMEECSIKEFLTDLIHFRLDISHYLSEC